LLLLLSESDRNNFSPRPTAPQQQKRPKAVQSGKHTREKAKLIFLIKDKNKSDF